MEKILNIIDNIKYTGYLWYSDKSEPDIFCEQYISEAHLDITNSYIVEGFLYSEKANLSYSIRFVDGEYRIVRYDISDANKIDINDSESFLSVGEVENITYKAHLKKEGIKAIKFKHIWSATPDENCEGMEVLRPAAMIFVGFIK